MKICLISVIHLWVNPRLVKEADALVEEGHTVVAITLAQDSWSYKRDKEFCKTKSWQVIQINMVKDNLRGCVTWFFMALRQKVFFELSKIFKNDLRIAGEAYCRGYSSLLRKALNCKTDFYIAHTQAALPIAARAAEQRGVRFGFDCEDLNAEANADGGRHPLIRKNIRLLEQNYLLKAASVTAASTPMAEYLSKQYVISLPTVIHNVFPKSELKDILEPLRRPHNKRVSMVWISATIGQGRGLEMAIEAMKRLPDCELHIFGRFVDRDFEIKFKKNITQSMTNSVFIHEVIPNLSMLRGISQYDVGLALEDGSCPNLGLTLTNKFFIYLQAGLTVAASDVSGQRSFIEKHPQIGFLIMPNNSDAFCEKILEYYTDREKLAKGKQSAWELGMEKYNWEHDKQIFLKAVYESV